MTESRCENCGEPLAGSYCAQCGQSDADYDVPIAQFATEFLSESFDLDARLRRTMKPLFLQPGLVPAEYVAGHRARFVPPVRLYVFASFAVFFVLSLTSGPLRVNLTNSGDDPEVPAAEATDVQLDADSASPPSGVAPDLPDPGPAEAGDTSAGEEESFSDRMAEGLARVTEDPDRFTDLFLNRLAQAMFFLLPGFALLLKVLYRRRLYVHHLVFAVYFHSFAFLWITIMELMGVVGLPWLTAAAELGVLWLPVYLFLAMRRYYADGRLKTFIRFGVLSISYFSLLTATMLALIATTLLSA